MNTSLNNLLEASSLSLFWTGNNGWIIRNEDKLIAFDLDLFNHERIRKPDFDLNLLCEKLDLLFITHEHEDHFSSETCRLLLAKSHCIFVIPKSCYEKALALGITANRMLVVSPGKTFSFDWIFVKCIRAVHGHINGSVYSGASLDDCGYMITFGGKTIYQPGDTLLLEEHNEMNKIDLLFVSPTEHNTGIENSLRLINQLKPRFIFPQHHSTYEEHEDNLFWTHGFVDEVYERLSQKEKESFIKLSQETVWQYRE